MTHRRAPTEVTADRLKTHLENYQGSLAHSEEDVLSRAIGILEEIANTWEAYDTDDGPEDGPDHH